MPIRLPEFIRSRWFWYGMLAVLVIPYTILCLKTPWFQDYDFFLHPWVNYIRNHGGIRSISHCYSNYPVPYLYFLTAISYLPYEPLIPIRLFSVLFSIIGGWYLGKIAYLKYPQQWVKPAVLSASLIIPTVALNGAYWGQCDSIYTAFVIISLYYLIKREMIWSMIWLGIAFSIKLQTVFIFPVYLVFLLRGELRWWHPIVAIATWVATWIPAILAGRPVRHIWEIYIRQIDSGDILVEDFINLWSLWPPEYPYHISVTITVLAVIALFAVWIYIDTRNLYLSTEFIVCLAATTVALVLLILPKMVERYLYLGDLLALVYIIYFPKMWLPAITLPFISLSSYSIYFSFCSQSYYGLHVSREYIMASSVLYIVSVAAMIIYLVRAQIPKLKPLAENIGKNN